MTKPRIYYGWIIVVSMAVAGILGMALGTLNFGLFIKPMGDDLGIGRATFGWAHTARQFASAVTAPLLGRLIDRFGTRLLLAVAGAIGASAVVGLAHITNSWQIIALFGVMGLVGMVGPGALVTTVPVAKWFVRKRGMALAFASAGVPVGGVIFVPLTQVFIDSFGWRDAWLLLAAIGGGGIVPIALMFVRRQPEDMGLVPDGDETVEGQVCQREPAGVATNNEVTWTLGEAVRTSTFWRLTVVFSVVMLGIGTVSIHRIPHFMDRGLDPKMVAYATGMDAGLAGLSMFAVGYFADRVPSRYLGTAAFGVLAFAAYLNIVADTGPMMFLAMGVFGVGIGAMLLMHNYLWADYFGRAHIGSIRGAVNPAILVFSGVGAPLAGYIRDGLGSYNPIWWVGIALLGTGALVMALTPKPQKSKSFDERYVEH